MALGGRTGDFGVPANCAHIGFIHSDDWKLTDDGFWVRDE